MDADEVTREVLDLRQAHLAANPPRGRRLLIHLPPLHADALWTDFRKRLSAEERSRIESLPGHPTDGGELFGMTIGVDEDSTNPWITELSRVVVNTSV